MGACNCMSKKTDTTLEVVNEKQDLAPVLSEEKPSLPEVINQLSTVIVQEPLPAKETVEETAQDPNLLVSQAQSLFRAYSARKVYLEFKNKPKPVIQVDFSILPLNFPSTEAKLKYQLLGKFEFPEFSEKEFKSFSILEEGKYYHGEVKFGQPEGFGTIFFPDGSMYEGCWRDGKMHGFGRLITSLGDVYIGEFANARMTGKGKMEYSTGNVYQGEWFEDKPEGYGEETATDGFTYVGQYKNGLKSGFGKSTWTDGSYFEGNFLNDLYHGKGKYVWVDKEYDGE